MADSTISALPPIGLLDPNALIPLVQAGVTSTVKASQVASLLAQISGQPLVSVGAGTGDAITASFTPQVSSLVQGASFLVRAPAANTLAAPTIALGSAGAKPIFKGANVPLQAGDISGPGHWLELIWDSTIGGFCLANPVYPAVAYALAQLKSSNGGPLAGFRNRIINGCMRVAQRPVVAGGGYENVDRWFLNTAGSNLTMSQYGGQNMLGPTFSTVMTVNGAAGNTDSNLEQRIESLMIRDLAGGWVTLSYWVYQNTGTTRTINTGFVYPNSLDNFSATTGIGNVSGAVIPSGVWTKVVAPMLLPAGAVNGLRVTVCGGIGAMGAGQSYALGYAQLEQGQVDTPFEQRPFSVEQALCMRYFESVTPTDRYGTTGSTCYFDYPFKVPKRVSPSIALPASPVCWNNSGATVTPSSFFTQAVNQNGFSVAAAYGGGVGGLQGQTYYASAEL